MTDPELIRALMAYVENRGLTDQEGADLLGMKSAWGFRKIRLGKTKRLSTESRRAAIRVLELQPAKESHSYADGVRATVGKMRSLLDELERSLPKSPSGGVDPQTAEQVGAVIERTRGKEQVVPPQKGVGGGKK